MFKNYVFVNQFIYVFIYFLFEEFIVTLTVRSEYVNELCKSESRALGALYSKEKQKYRGMFETQKSGNKTSPGDECMSL